MGLRDRAKFTGNRNTGNSVFLDQAGLYKIEIEVIGFYNSAILNEDGEPVDKFWKISGHITERDTDAPSGQEGPYSPLEVGTEVVSIHNLAKDRYGFSRNEREEIAGALGTPVKDLVNCAGRSIIVEIWPKTTGKGRTILVRSWASADEDAGDNERAAEDAVRQDTDNGNEFGDMPF